MVRSILVLTAIAGFLACALPVATKAADLSVAPNTPQAAEPAGCGPCGCLTVTYVRHREMLSTYGAGFDPRNFDTAEPYFYYGRVRSYPRFYVDGVAVQHQCQD